jgi:predicted ATPase
MTRGDVPVARGLAEEIAKVAAATEDASVHLGSYNGTGMVAFHAGDFVACIDAMEHGLEIYDPHEHDPNLSPAFWGGHNTGVSCAVHAAWSLWATGRADRGAARMAQALDWARAGNHPFTLAFACHFSATFHQVRREVETAQALAAEGVNHAREHGFDLFASLDSVHRGWLHGDPAELRDGIAAYRATGSGFGMPTYLGFLAEAYGKQDRPDEGLPVVAEALALADATDAHYWDADLERIRGALSLQAHPRAHKDAEACFMRAIEIAQRQSAKTLELRAVTALCRLWRQQGKVDEARARLADACGWFTEGLDTADQRDAKALLSELDGRPRRRR